MEHEIEKLLVQLDLETLRILPCYYDLPGKIQFRIGLRSKGPLIEFRPENSELYTLSFTNLSGEFYPHPIVNETEHFFKCQKIYHLINGLCTDEKYKNEREEKIDIMLGNLVRLISPIFKTLEQINKSK